MINSKTGKNRIRTIGYKSSYRLLLLPLVIAAILLVGGKDIFDVVKTVSLIWLTIITYGVFFFSVYTVAEDIVRIKYIFNPFMATVSIAVDEIKNIEIVSYSTRGSWVSIKFHLNNKSISIRAALFKSEITLLIEKLQSLGKTVIYKEH